jgi:hypothetical protein
MPDRGPVMDCCLPVEEDDISVVDGGGRWDGAEVANCAVTVDVDERELCKHLLRVQEDE